MSGEKARRTHSPDVRAKISAALKGQAFSAERRLALRVAWLDRAERMIDARLQRELDELDELISKTKFQEAKILYEAEKHKALHLSQLARARLAKRRKELEALAMAGGNNGAGEGGDHVASLAPAEWEHRH